MNGTTGTSSSSRVLPQQAEARASKSLEEGMEEGKGACTMENGAAAGAALRARRGAGGSGGEEGDGAAGGAGAGAGVAEAEAAAAAGALWWRRIGINKESEIRWHVRLELALLRRYWPWVALAVLAEYTHLVAHNLIYYMEGIYYPDGPPPALKDLGLMLLADRIPSNFEWVVGALTCFLVALVLSLALCRVTLKNVPWGGPQLEVVGHGDPTGSGRPRTTVAAPVAVVLKRASQALALALILRVCTFLVTMMPNPAEYCHGENWNPPRTAGDIFARWAVEGSCGDLLYSGHTSHGMVLTLILLRYAPGLRVIKALAFTTMTLLALALLAFKSHYSSDVIVAVYVSLMIWRLMPPEPATLDGDELRIEEPVVCSNCACNCNGAAQQQQTTAQGSAASSPALSVEAAGGKQLSAPPAVFADAREEELPEEDEGLLLEEGRGGDGGGGSEQAAASRPAKKEA